MKHLIAATPAAAAKSLAIPAFAAVPAPQNDPVVSASTPVVHSQKNIAPHMIMAQDKQDNGASPAPSTESSGQGAAEPAQQQDNEATQPEQQPEESK